MRTLKQAGFKFTIAIVNIVNNLWIIFTLGFYDWLLFNLHKNLSFKYMRWMLENRCIEHDNNYKKDILNN